MEQHENQAKVKSLYKALLLLNYFTPEHPERGIQELSELSGLLKSTVHNIISTFCLSGIIEKNENSGKYRFSNKIFEFYNVLLSNNKDRPVIKATMNRLAEATGENVYLAIPSNDNILYIDAAYPQNNFFSRSIIGVKAGMYCTGIGKAMLAFLGEEYIQKIISQGFTAYTPFTLISEDALRKELELVRQNGYAIDNMEHENGIRCIGVPIFNYRDNVVAGLSVSGPSPRITDDKIPIYSQMMIQAAKELRTLINP